MGDIGWTRGCRSRYEARRKDGGRGVADHGERLQSDSRRADGGCDVAADDRRVHRTPLDRFVGASHPCRPAAQPDPPPSRPPRGAPSWPLPALLPTRPPARQPPGGTAAAARGSKLCQREARRRPTGLARRGRGAAATQTGHGETVALSPPPRAGGGMGGTAGTPADGVAAREAPILPALPPAGAGACWAAARHAQRPGLSTRARWGGGGLAAVPAARGRRRRRRGVWRAAPSAAMTVAIGTVRIVCT